MHGVIFNEPLSSHSVLLGSNGSVWTHRLFTMLFSLFGTVWPARVLEICSPAGKSSHIQAEEQQAACLRLYTLLLHFFSRSRIWWTESLRRQFVLWQKIPTAKNRKCSSDSPIWPRENALRRCRVEYSCTTFMFYYMASLSVHLFPRLLLWPTVSLITHCSVPDSCSSANLN